MEQEIKCLSMKNHYFIHPNIYCVPSKLKAELVGTLSRGFRNGVVDTVTYEQRLKEGQE